jgi:hypothetical protein
LEKVFNEFIIEPRMDNSPPRARGDTATLAAAVAGAKRKGAAITATAASPQKKAAAAAVTTPKAAPSLPVLRLPNPLFRDAERLKEQHFREKELVDKLSPSQLRQGESEEVIT